MGKADAGPVPFAALGTSRRSTPLYKRPAPYHSHVN
eukprot:CAMPEP_0113299266 /NCGR_PEP_ID=MMETSP0010_2-20120614/1372_1 /TAXON_ID=216773 ORGANISM="Corethron hystrix, Strain 308" /NCGR_SAMPLE_ID=MMETSP0010_2 /ASSEMBLY_ACC=CAM_ASM_000155 /LENGTH=35 /DNA_ID=CAMNT_0000152471 /DNA_START=551 /DNA_END=655 /DNA_ORIENTATION=+ /assembly_acc=CAM_ASM_000155